MHKVIKPPALKPKNIRQLAKNNAQPGKCYFVRRINSD